MAVTLASFDDDLAACRGDRHRLLDLVVQRASELLGDGSVLALLSDDGSTLEPATMAASDPTVLEAMRHAVGRQSYAIGNGVAGRAVRSRRPVVLNHVDPNELWHASADFNEQHPIRALAVVPLIAYGEVVGSLGVMRLASGLPYTDEAVIALEALAARAALALQDGHAEYALSSSDYVAMFEHSADGVLFSAPDGRVLAANPAACALLGMPELDIRAAGRHSILVDDERAREAVARRAETGSVRAEVMLRRGDGSVFPAALSSSIFLNEHGQVRACIVFRDVSNEVHLRDRLEEQSITLARLAREDELTGLRNRRAFMSDAAHALTVADRENVPVQLLYFDVDGLKSINDAHGHDAGDSMLRGFASALTRTMRMTDVTARVGGDEFVVLLVDATTADAARAVHRIAQAATLSDGAAIGFSHGVAGRMPGSAVPLERLVFEADRRMYERKRAGRRA